MTLARLQRDFHDHIVRGSPAVEAAVPEAARRGLAVYRHAYRANLIACLKDTFEKTAAWLGDEAFEAAALEHIAEQPPTSWTLSDFGDGFDRTLAGLYPADPEVAELAWLDLRLRRAFDGPDATISDVAALADVDWELAVLDLAPTLSLASITSNVVALWTAMDDQETPPPVVLLESPLGVAVWREALSPRFRTLRAAEYGSLRRAREGASFGELCADLATGFPGEDEAAAAFAGGLLAGWLSEGIVIGVKA